NTLTGRATGTPLGVAADLPRPAEVDAEALERAALAVSPRLRAREAATRRREAQLDLARRDLRPDFAWGAAYGHRGRLDPEITGEFGVRVPLHRQRRQAAAVTEASHRLDSARHEIETERRRISAMVRDLASRARLAAELEILYANAIVPRAQSALESAASSYGVGRIDFLALLSDVNDLLAHRLELITQQHERILALADLEPITGRMLAQPGEAP
ncbi:MAG TPA: TolC family protein, partial [Candidatus Polarisedimenticolia bacterium]|nr:TolC family protein [Candidatus Polarisedimenticolia bacterium]